MSGHLFPGPVSSVVAEQIQFSILDFVVVGATAVSDSQQLKNCFKPAGKL